MAAAARLLGASRQPLFGGLGTDVAGARALYPLACATGAICDAGAGEALMQGLRALQDRGEFTTTLAEVRTRADLIVFVGGVPSDLAPLIGPRCGIGDAQVPQRQVVVLGPGPGDDAMLAHWAGQGGVGVDTVPLHGDLFDTLALLCALVDQRAVPAAPDALRGLAQRLRAARYAVLVGAPARLPAQGALIVEAVHRIVGSLNRSDARRGAVDRRRQRRGHREPGVHLAVGPAAAFARGARAGWSMSRWPSTRRGCWPTARSMRCCGCRASTPSAVPPPNRLPMVVLGHPALAAALPARGPGDRLHPGGHAGHRQRRPPVPHRRHGADAAACRLSRSPADGGRCGWAASLRRCARCGEGGAA